MTKTPRKPISTSPTKRTMQYLRARGFMCGVTERFDQHRGPFGRRVDLFGFVDLLAVDSERTIAVQACVGSSVAARRMKIIAERTDEARAWLSHPSREIEVWGWRKLKVPGQRKWFPRIERITLATLDGKTPKVIDPGADLKRGISSVGDVEIPF